ncbi:MAG: class I SAM-dependent methyltransferase, partial [Calditrichia bacterium]
VNIVYSERIIEYPILFQYLDIQSHRILDFGCVEDLLPVHLASLGYSVTGLDFRPYPFTHKNFNFIQADILSWEPPCEEFDTVISISTIEHVGLSAYGDPVNKDGDKIAVEKLWSSLNVGGKLIITVPAGKPCIERGMKIYNEEKIRKLIPNIETIRFFYKKRRISDWVETTSEVISELVYEDYYALTPAQGVAFIVAKKG